MEFPQIKKKSCTRRVITLSWKTSGYKIYFYFKKKKKKELKHKVQR